MKRYYAILVCVIILTGAFNCWGQVTTREIKYPDLKGENILLKTAEGGFANIMYYEWANKSYFLYTEHNIFPLISPHYPRIFPLPMPSVPTVPFGTIQYRIKDMRVIGNKCFCCGKKFTPVGEEEPGLGDRNTIYDSIGFIGWIDLDSAYAYNPSIRFHTVDVDSTFELIRLAIKTSTNDTLVAAIGTSSDAHLPCLVAMCKNGTTDFYQVHKIYNPSEQLMDVVFTERMLVTVSKFLDEHRSFGLRGANYNDLFIYPPSTTDYQTNHKIITPDHSIKCWADSWHRDDVEMKMIAEPKDNYVTVGYDAFNSDYGGQKYLALYRILVAGNYYQLKESQFVLSIPDTNKTLSDMGYCAEDSTIYLLSHFRPGWGNVGSMHKVSLSRMKYGCLFFDYLVPLAFDFSTSSSKDVWMGGVYNESNTIFRVYQSFNYYYIFDDKYYLETCYQSNYGDNCIMDPPPEIYDDGNAGIWSNRKSIDWGSYKLTPETVYGDTVCVNECLRGETK